MRGLVEFVRRRPAAAPGLAAIVALLVAGFLFSDPPTSDDRDRPLPPVKEVLTPSPTATRPTPTPSPSPIPTPSPSTSRLTPGPDPRSTPGPLDPGDVL